MTAFWLAFIAGVLNGLALWAYEVLAQEAYVAQSFHHQMAHHPGYAPS